MNKLKQVMQSSRFWAVVLNAVILYLEKKGLVGQDELVLITAIVAPFVGLRTIDKFRPKK